jgi:ArsR family transcriptional regulator
VKFPSTIFVQANIVSLEFQPQYPYWMVSLISLFKALSDETRLRIVGLLAESGELCVCDIESVVSCPQAKISRHLAYLRRAGIVQGKKKGLWMIYSLSTPRNGDHELILKCVKDLLRDNRTVRADSADLQKNIQKGCCAAMNLCQ